MSTIHERTFLGYIISDFVMDYYQTSQIYYIWCDETNYGDKFLFKIQSIAK